MTFPWSTLGHSKGNNLTHVMQITDFFVLFDCRTCIDVGSQRLIKCQRGFELVTS